MEEYISKNELLKVITSNIAEAPNERCVQLLEAILNAPTADVVPKSEVEKLKADLIVWKQDRFNLYQRLELYETTRQKVAREIFEEIETCMKGFEDDDDGYLLKKCEFEFFMRELKKKYTENENG